MAKLLLGSILWVPLLIARFAASRRGARGGMRLAVILSLWFMVFYVLALVYLYFRLGG
jgi:uncharacterized membrane protein (GlpM family)